VKDNSLPLTQRRLDAGKIIAQRPLTLSDYWVEVCRRSIDPKQALRDGLETHGEEQPLRPLPNFVDVQSIDTELVRATVPTSDNQFF
jgi:hypothetical protein